MNFSTELIFDITIIMITATLIAGVVLGSIALFRILATLKLRNKMLQQATRPYIFCQRNHQQLEIRNNGQVPIKIDAFDSQIDLTTLIGKVLPAGQTFLYRIDESSQFTITVKYHDQITNYTDSFNI
ncbi:hypothetical protein [Companilactobacillus kimchiensis]|uniref:Uncharacterized protein n=1 Tax=Companilactobacillus kimchiensis TaxID=993692 RepID=A0A0R2LG21_9LACO|nr:hypothetical protein [Companilactobacillus kimchiensis]KRO00821.1 hypothetical protein IV57_GL000142 [Companilactobacillus kimchiensis]